MALAQSKPASYDDIVRLPEHLVGEIIDGELHVSPRPALAHSLAGSTLGAELGPPFQQGRGGPGGWWILFEPEMHFGSDVVVPDLAGWRRERVPQAPSGAFMTLAPDWVCELLSPSTERLDRARKLPLYARVGVGHAWLINPAARTLEVLRLESGRWVVDATYADDQVARAEPFTAIELDLVLLWGQSRKRPGSPRKPAPRRSTRAGRRR